MSRKLNAIRDARIIKEQAAEIKLLTQVLKWMVDHTELKEVRTPEDVEIEAWFDKYYMRAE
jgi:hypothetical protein